MFHLNILRGALRLLRETLCNKYSSKILHEDTRRSTKLHEETMLKKPF
jgi:hypothetical protein